MSAIKMATLNAARHYGVDDIIGSVAPSRKANFLLMDSLENMTVKKVYHQGRLVAENGDFLCAFSACHVCSDQCFPIGVWHGLCLAIADCAFERNGGAAHPSICVFQGKDRRFRGYGSNQSV